MTSTRKLQQVTTAMLVIAVAALCLVVGSTPAVADGSLSYSFKTSGSPGATQGTGFYLGPSGDGIVNPYEYGYVPMCMMNADPSSGMDALCLGATVYCENTGRGNGIAMRVWRRLGRAVGPHRLHLLPQPGTALDVHPAGPGDGRHRGAAPAGAPRTEGQRQPRPQRRRRHPGDQLG